ncbi:hypothetical protein [Dyella caseinilytica]|uniref:Uncharacterized protein n=1 Tax=Dyella caseinilytica TaxID=1849581 RepID=A0ABX7GT27_9GAMM|nr:hypothetical protein [Dyella caseinilytica]QRN53603.1 hypothetical protein ISN74_19720 [Dyella caseinilytica]GFZ87793.1 hypothetical protein GCM10011408_03070 [Dyella caseinilytica]
MYRKSVSSVAIDAISMLGASTTQKAGDEKARTLIAVAVAGYRTSLGKAFDIKRGSDHSTQRYL